MNALSTPFLFLALLGADGQPAKEPAAKPKLVDYESELNDKLSKGITAETNANALLWKAFGPTPEGGHMPAGYFKRLGIEEPPEKGEYIIGISKFALDHLQLQREELEGLYNQQGWARKQPWAAKDYPFINAWLTKNEQPLAIVLEAVKRPEYYNPLVSRKSETEPGSLIGCLLPSVQKCREIASTLTARAMLRVHEGKHDEAWADLLACHRLARLLARGGTLIETLVAIAIEAIATDTDLAFLEHAKLTSKQIQERLNDLRNLSPFPSIASKFDLTERYTFLDSLALVRRGNGLAMVQGLVGGKVEMPTPEELKALETIDWAPAIANGNKWYDRLVAALESPTRAERFRALDRIEAELKVLKESYGEDLAKLRKDLLDKDQQNLVGKAIGDVLISLLMPATRKVGEAHDRMEQTHANLQVAFAMAAYRIDNGRYPAKLDALAPKYLAKVPGDLFSGQPLIYKPEEKGYLFYSVGVNGVDDGGRWYDDEPRGDDPRVRMPLPPLNKE